MHRLDFENARGAAAVAQLARPVANRSAMERLREEVRRVRPDVVHVHNTWFAGGPGLLRALREDGVPRVVTLHNFRVQCANFLCLRDGEVCTDCVGTAGWEGVRRRCYRQSYVLSALARRSARARNGLAAEVARASSVQFLNPFMRELLAEPIGLPEERAYAIGNYCAPVADDAAVAPEARAASRDLLFVGRLHGEKGVPELLAAWRAIEAAGELPEHRLHLAGDGPLRPEVEAAAAECARLDFHGWVGPEERDALLARAALAITPSRWFEGQPMVILEALAAGLPVVLPDLGPMRRFADAGAAELFGVGDPDALRRALVSAVSDPAALAAKARAARDLHAAEHAPGAVLPRIEAMYADALTRP